MILKEEKNKIINDFKQHSTDTGSIEVQVALLTEQIENLTETFKNNPKDFGSKQRFIKNSQQKKKIVYIT